MQEGWKGGHGPPTEVEGLEPGPGPGQLWDPSVVVWGRREGLSHQGGA